MKVKDLKRKLRGIPDDYVVVLSAHDAVTGKACSAEEIDEDCINSWNEDTLTSDFHSRMFVISS